jgi:hypothetical protein
MACSQRGSTGITVACRVFGSTVTTAARLALQLKER